MKKFAFMALAVAALTLPGCSSDDLKPGSDPDNGGSQTEEAGNAYVNVCLTLPTEKSSRANDVYDDGEASEYAVKNVLLVLFKSDETTPTEATAKVVGAYPLALAWNDDPQNQNITSQGYVVQKITAESTTSAKDYSDYYALAILNNNGIVSADDFNSDWSGKSFKGKTLSEIAALCLERSSAGLANISTFVKGMKSNGIFMTNAVLATNPGTGETNTSTVLVNLKSKIYPTEEEARSSAAAEIVVERGVAKVQVSDGISSGSTVTIDNKALSYKILGWKLTNTSENSYIIRNWGHYANGYKTDSIGDAWFKLTNSAASTDPTNQYRFAGVKEVKVADSQTLLSQLASPYLYRTYWALDPTYNPNVGATEAVPGLINNEDGEFLEVGKYDYCLENTFDVANQNAKNTTAAVIKVQLATDLSSPADLYTLDGVHNILYTEDKLIGHVSSTLNDKVGLAEAFEVVLTAQLTARNKKNHTDWTEEKVITFIENYFTSHTFNEIKV